jgi:hypothetical protein
MSNRRDATPSLGGRWAVVLFVVALVAFVAESELTQVRGPFVIIFSCPLTFFFSVCSDYSWLPTSILSLVCALVRAT